MAAAFQSLCIQSNEYNSRGKLGCDDSVGTHSKNAQDIALIQGPLNPGYASDDEASGSDNDRHEPRDSGRTRSSTRRANQVVDNDGNKGRRAQQRNQASNEAAKDGKGRKRKKPAQDGSGEDSDEGNEKSRARLGAVQVENKPEEPTCLCPKNVMRCIGILPSLPIIGRFYESDDDSDSSFDDDLRHTVLPSVARSRPEHEHG